MPVMSAIFSAMDQMKAETRKTETLKILLPEADERALRQSTEKMPAQLNALRRSRRAR